MIKESKLVKKKRTTRGKGEKDRMEWALVSKTNPKKILRWFGPSKPSKKQVAKEERRVHSFASDNLILKELIVLANELDSRGLIKEADMLDRIVEEDLKDEGPSEQVGGQKVFVVTYEIPYEGSSVVGVFASLEAANKAIEEADDDMVSGHRYEVDEHELGDTSGF